MGSHDELGDSGGEPAEEPPVSGPGAAAEHGTMAEDGTMIVQLGGETRRLAVQRDYTGDGRPDAMAETADGRVIVFADTEDNETGAAGPDGRADEAYVVDKATGRVVGAAHVDPASGRWVRGTEAGGPGGPAVEEPSGTPAGATGAEPSRTPAGATGAEPSGAGGDTAGTGGDPGVAAGAPGGPSVEPDGDGTDSPDSTDGAGTDDPGTMIVELGGETRELPAERDYTGDGRPDAATETADGRVIVFADTEDNETGAARPDGRADEAYVVDKATGRVVGAAHVDPRTGEWVEGADAPPAPPPTGGEVDR